MGSPKSLFQLDFQAEISAAFSVHRLYTTPSHMNFLVPYFEHMGGGEEVTQKPGKWETQAASKIQNPDNFQVSHAGEGGGYPESRKPGQICRLNTQAENNVGASG